MPEAALRPAAIAGDLFRRESARLVAALTRVFGPTNLPLAEDVVQDALVSALSAWQLGAPDDPRAWILRTAKNRAIDVMRRQRRLSALPDDEPDDGALAQSIDHALESAEVDASQLGMMFSICHDDLSADTHVTLILRFLSGLGPREIARAFLVDVPTVDRRLHRGRERLQSLGRLHDVEADDDVRARLPSVIRALYLLFNEGFHGTDAESPLQSALCDEAMRLVTLLQSRATTASPEVHALAALFAFLGARLTTRMGNDGVFVPLAEQDRTQWSRALVDHGVVCLGMAASGKELSRWHIEAGIACEHALAPSVAETRWAQIVKHYDALYAVHAGPVVALNRALAVSYLEGEAEGQRALDAVRGDPRLVSYPFYWAAFADLARRRGDIADAVAHYESAARVSRSRAERVAYERQIARLQSDDR